MKTVKEIAELTKVSVRTLHYYDEIGLLRPTETTESGYRLYDDTALDALYQIRLFKVLGFTLKDIREIILNPDFDKNRVIKCQKKLLLLKRNYLDNLITKIEGIENNDKLIDIKQSDMNEIEWELVWNEIYKNNRNIEQGILSTVIMAKDVFKKNKVKKVLDLGCGTGRHAIYLAEKGFNVTATDISSVAIEITRNKAKKAGVNITTLCHDIRELPFKDNVFDAVLCTWVAGHGKYDDVKKHTNEMLRVTKSGGIIFSDYQSKNDRHFGIGVEIEEDTFLENMPREDKIPHHYFDESKIMKLYTGNMIKVTPYTYPYLDNSKISSDVESYIVVCKKR